MSNRVNPALIADLARLARRYPPEDWQALLALLNDESQRGQIVALLEELSEASRHIRSRKRAGAKTSTSRLLESLKATHPRKAELLRDLRIRLLAGDLFPSLSDLRAFAAALGVEDLPSARKREQNINHLVRCLADLPYDHVVQALSGTTASRRDLGGEYERWVSFILGRGSSRQGSS